MASIPPTSLTLLCNLQEGCRPAETWKAFVDLYRGVILGWCLRRDLPADVADDLTQDILFKLFQELPRYTHDPSRGRFRGWLKTLVNNVLTDHWRKQRHRIECRGVGGTDVLEQVAALAGPDVTDELSGLIEDQPMTKAAQVIARVQAKVEPPTWEAAYRHLVERRPAAEVAVELGLTVANVYKACARVKKHLEEESRHV